MWYGLTRVEAETRCRDLDLACRFALTLDPKTAERAHGSDTLCPAADFQPVGTVQKVIRAKEEDGVMTFLLGCFAEEKRESVPHG